MASAMIHIAVAKEINKTLQMEEKPLLLGSIAPDLSKQIGTSRSLSHFENGDDLPNLEHFKEKYGSMLSHPFIMGYYIHLYTDYLWFRYFMTEIYTNQKLVLKNGEMISVTSEEKVNMIYQDYTNLNIQLIDEYDLDLSLFYEPVQIPTIQMDEIPVDQLQRLVDAMGVIIKNSKETKSYTFDLPAIKQFIKQATLIITSAIID